MATSDDQRHLRGDDGENQSRRVSRRAPDASPRTVAVVWCCCSRPRSCFQRYRSWKLIFTGRHRHSRAKITSNAMLAESREEQSTPWAGGRAASASLRLVPRSVHADPWARPRALHAVWLLSLAFGQDHLESLAGLAEGGLACQPLRPVDHCTLAALVLGSMATSPCAGWTPDRGGSRGRSGPTSTSGLPEGVQVSDEEVTSAAGAWECTGTAP